MDGTILTYTIPDNNAKITMYQLDPNTCQILNSIPLDIVITHMIYTLYKQIIPILDDFHIATGME